MPNQIKRVVAVYDMHYPKIHKPTWEAILDFLSKNKVDEFVFGGDQLDLECISHHTKGLPLYRTRRAYQNDIEGFQRDVLAELDKVLTKSCKRVWIEGNHERFGSDLIEEHPELEGAIDHIRLLQLREHKWNIIPLGHTYRVGKLNICHGETLSGVGNQAGMYPSKKAVEMYAGNVLAGHTHAPQSWTRISPVDQHSKWQGWIAPICGMTNPSYLRNRPTAWLTGMIIIELQSDGNFNLFSVNIPNGHFVYGGKFYGK